MTRMRTLSAGSRHASAATCATVDLYRGRETRAAAQRLNVMGVEQPLAPERRAEDDEDALDQLGLEARLGGHLSDGGLLPWPREEILGEAEGEPPLAAGALEVVERVPALAHPRHHP